MAVPAEYQASVDYLRLHGSAASTDVFDAVTYWDDDQLYAILNEYIVHNTIGLRPINRLCTVYTTKPPASWQLREIVEVYVNNTVVSPTHDTLTNAFTFITKPVSDPYLQANYFNMTEALAHLWETKASQRFELIRVKGGANQMFIEQEYEHCLAKARYYRSRIIRRFKR